MSHRSRFHATLGGGILILAATLIIAWKQAGSRPDDAAAAPSIQPPPDVQPADPERNPDEDAARELLAELSDLRTQQSAIPKDLQLKADKLIDSKRTPYQLRIQLALSAFDEKWGPKLVEIMFRNEISKRPYETIAELYRLVPEGPLQQRVVESTFQTASLSPGDAPAAVAFLESVSPVARDRVTSLIGSRLRETKDLETMKALAASCRSEDLKNRFQWHVTEMEKAAGAN